VPDRFTVGVGIGREDPQALHTVSDATPTAARPFGLGEEFYALAGLTEQTARVRTNSSD
jgi:hypothetical protein